MEEEAKLTCQAELFLAKMVLDQTANRFQEIEYLEEKQESWCRRLGRGKGGHWLGRRRWGEEQETRRGEDGGKSRRLGGENTGVFCEPQDTKHGSTEAREPTGGT